MAALFNSVFKSQLVSKWLTTASSVIGHRFKTSGPHFPQLANLPPHYPINGTGFTYETRIVRKRVVKDPNVPTFDRPEGLKWADWRMLRDCRRRHIFARYHPMRQFIFTIRKSPLLPSNITEGALEEELKLPLDSTIHHLNNRCIISSRARGNLKRYKISRHQWRLLADYNLLSGVAKACW